MSTTNDYMYDGLARVAMTLDEDQLTALVSQYDAELIRYCYVVSGNRDIAQDAVQNAWKRLWTHPPLRDPSKIRSWLMRVAGNEARQILRAGRRDRRLEELSMDNASQLAHPEPEDGLDLGQVLSRLSVDERQLLALRYLIGFDSNEIGAMLGLSPEGARSRLHRLVQRLRREMQ